MLKNSKTVILDYGIGNIESISNAFIYCGAEDVSLSKDKAIIERADRLILPGVGAFANGMNGLKENKLIPLIKSFVESGKPLMGICLGMQMLASSSEEFGIHDGLDLIPGKVKPMPLSRVGNKKVKLPFIGWASLNKNIKGVSKNKMHIDSHSFYFVHSYYFEVKDELNLTHYYDYDGFKVSAIVQKDNIIGTQFHPEKRGDSGLNLIETFIRN